MKAFYALGLAALLAGGVATAADEDYAKKIVGVWEVTGGADLPAGAVAEFTKDGKLTIAGQIDGKPAKQVGTYKIEKDKLSVKLAYLGETTNASTRIIKLTDEVMETRDADKQVTTYRRKKK